MQGKDLSCGKVHDDQDRITLGSPLRHAYGLSSKNGHHSSATRIMGPNVSWKSDPILPSSVVIASGNPGPGFLAPTTALCLSATLRESRTCSRPLTKRSWKRGSASPKASLLFQSLFPHEEVTAYSDFYNKRSNSCR